jgi:hypothetical protein
MKLLALGPTVFAQLATYPPGCTGPAFPDSNVCLAMNWDLGAEAVDKCAPLGPYPVSGQQVYIQDPLNFCIMLPDPDSEYLKQNYYSKGLKPTIVQAEGYVRAFCSGEYKTPGALSLPKGGITSANVLQGTYPNGKDYMQISGFMNCDALNINCGTGLYDDGGQYDAVTYRNCGKEPYSGVDGSKHSKFPEYIEQAGNGQYCMRVCVKGQQESDPCNVKWDTKGCAETMNLVIENGFTSTDKDGNVKAFADPNPPGSTENKPKGGAKPSTSSSITNGNFSVLFFGLLLFR